jgi:hypothetical protein
MGFQQDGSASAQTLSLLVAAAVFIGALGMVIITSQQSGGDRSAADSAAQDIEATSLAEILVGSPGVGWADGADQVQRLGLAASNGSGLDAASIAALKGAMAVSAANGRVDYPDAQASLGLDPDGSQQFHIRMYPVGMNDVYDSSLSGISVGYIADFSSLPTVTIPLVTPSSLYVVEANAQLNVSMGPSTILEREAIRQLGLDFTDRVYMIPGTPTVGLDQLLGADIPLTTVLGVSSIEGDVYPDVKSYLDATLPSRLSQYDMLIVGSGVQHSTLTANAVKDGIRDWVLAGGMLVVMGSNDQAYQWLQPLFHAGVSTVNGAAMAPDVSHPLLKEPNELSWTSYDNHDKGWDIKDTGSGAHYDDFSHVIVQDGEDVLAISKDGAFGSGRILLTTYLPREIAATMGLGEAMGFVENIVLFADRTNLYLEYGPQAPAGTPVSIAVRQSWLWDDVLGQVPVRVEIQTWG